MATFFRGAEAVLPHECGAPTKVQKQLLRCNNSESESVRSATWEPCVRAWRQDIVLALFNFLTRDVQTPGEAF
jgi:hypothetical protein